MNGILLKEEGLIYWFVPKVMCTSMKVLIAKHQNLQFKNPHEASFARCSADSEPDSLRGFAIVRNPFSRLVSLYCDKIRKGYRGYGFPNGVEKFVLGGYGKFTENMSFEDFVYTCLTEIPRKDANVHWKPQIYQIPVSCNYIFKQEDTQYLHAFLQSNGIDTENLKRHNQSPKKHVRWIDFYRDSKLVDLVEEYYMSDFTRFNYELISKYEIFNT